MIYKLGPDNSYDRIRIAGIGGQGVKYAGVLFGHVAIQAGFHAAQIVVYNPAMRGGLIYTDITVATLPIVSPYFEVPEILCLMNDKVWSSLAKDVNPQTLIIIDSDVINPLDLGLDESMQTNLVEIPISSTATEVGGTANIVLIGYLSGQYNFLTIENTQSIDNAIETHNYKKFLQMELDLLRIEPSAFQSAVEELSPMRYRESNMKSFNAGLKLFQKSIG
ncbi:MAG: 2-oxoacid:acceptor oxidoreductase family protein [Promethearchaeota archaeon]